MFYFIFFKKRLCYYFKCFQFSDFVFRFEDACSTKIKRDKKRNDRERGGEETNKLIL